MEDFYNDIERGSPDHFANFIFGVVIPAIVVATLLANC